MPDTPTATTDVSYELAAELAANLYTTEQVLDRFELEPDQLKHILRTPHFKEVYRNAKIIWCGTDNVKERIRAKSALLLEDSILPIYALIHNESLPAPARIEAFAKLVAIADMQPTRQDAAPSADRFVLNISVGEEHQKVVIDAEPAVPLPCPPSFAMLD